MLFNGFLYIHFGKLQNYKREHKKCCCGQQILSLMNCVELQHTKSQSFLTRHFYSSPVNTVQHLVKIFLHNVKVIMKSKGTQLLLLIHSSGIVNDSSMNVISVNQDVLAQPLK